MSEMTEQEFWAALAPGPEPDPPCWRLYHDDQGWPLFYSMENVAGNYIEIDRETYLHPPKHGRVIDGKLVVLNTCRVSKLTPASMGTPCSQHDVCVVVDADKPHTKWKITTYDTN